MQYMGSECVHSGIVYHAGFSSSRVPRSGYLASCHPVVTCARKIANAITASIPSLYVLGSAPTSIVAFASRDKDVDALEVGDVMRKRGWHLTAVAEPKGVHITCTVQVPFLLVVVPQPRLSLGN